MPERGHVTDIKPQQAQHRYQSVAGNSNLQRIASSTHFLGEDKPQPEKESLFIYMRLASAVGYNSPKTSLSRVEAKGKSFLQPRLSLKNPGMFSLYSYPL